MKYLKDYKIFESSQDSIDYIQDIFSDLRDNYFEVEVRTTKEVGNLYHNVIVDHLKNHHLNKSKIVATEIIEILIRKYPENTIFNYSEIEPEVRSSVSYMLSDGWSYVLDPVFTMSSGLGYHIDDTHFSWYKGTLKGIDGNTRDGLKKLTAFGIRFYR